jgi:hypothetical protein
VFKEYNGSCSKSIWIQFPGFGSIVFQWIFGFATYQDFQVAKKSGLNRVRVVQGLTGFRGYYAGCFKVYLLLFRGARSKVQGSD